MGTSNEDALNWEIGYTIMRASEKPHRVIVCKTEQEKDLYIARLEEWYPFLKFGDQRKPHVVVGDIDINDTYRIYSEAYIFMGGADPESDT